MMTKSSSEDLGRDFFEAQVRDSEQEYFIYIEVEPEPPGEGFNYYFWFSSPRQLLNSIINNMGTWDWLWRIEYDEAAAALRSIIDTHNDATLLPDELRSSLGKYIYENSGIHLYAWGTFKQLCSSDSGFCMEIRSDFRDQVWDAESCEDAEALSTSRPITADEQEAFLDFLHQTSM